MLPVTAELITVWYALRLPQLLQRSTWPSTTVFINLVRMSKHPEGPYTKRPQAVQHSYSYPDHNMSSGSSRQHHLPPPEGLPSATGSTSYSTSDERPRLHRISTAPMPGEEHIKEERFSSPDWNEIGPSQPSSDSTILRRREANRLAAQRFRNRKKGYQDSLEGRVKQLEEERTILVKRLEQADEQAFHGSRSHSSPSLHRPRLSSDQYPYPHFGRPSARIASPVAEDIRVASLEAANRRLQDELKSVSDENAQLHATLNKWIEWERTLSYRREHQPPTEVSCVG